MEAFGVIYFLGFIIAFFIGMAKTLNDSGDVNGPAILLLSPVWPIIYLRLIITYFFRRW